MEYAKSLALGGKIVYAEQPKYLEFSDLMLRCAFCGEPVLFKSGTEKKPHFAHFPNLPSRSLEECILRQKAASNQPGRGIFNLVKGKGQRFEAFEAMFLDIFKQGNEDFKENLKLFEESDKYSNSVVALVVNYLVEQLIYGIDECIKISRSLHKKDYPHQAYLREQILFEAVDYLTVSSARRTLKVIALYNLQDSESFSDGKKSEFDRSSFRSQVYRSLAEAPWYEFFKEINQQFEVMECLGIKPSISELMKRNKFGVWQNQ